MLPCIILKTDHGALLLKTIYWSTIYSFKSSQYNHFKFPYASLSRPSSHISHHCTPLHPATPTLFSTRQPQSTYLTMPSPFSTLSSCTRRLFLLPRNVLCPHLPYPPNPIYPNWKRLWILQNPIPLAFLWFLYTTMAATCSMLGM